MLAEGARLEKMPLDDPVSAHQALISAYSRTKAAPAFVEPTFGKGLRGSVQRAKVDQEDAEDLKDWVAKYGRHLQQIMAELEVTDRALRSNPSFEAAKLAARHGAPAVESEIPAYEARMAAKVQKAQLEQRAAIQESMAPGSSRQNSRYVGDRGTGSVRDAIARVRGAM